MAKRIIDPNPFAHTDLSWPKRKLRNELVAIARGDFTSKWIDYRRIYLTSFLTMVEAVNYQIRQYLLTAHNEHRINLTEKQRKVLSKEEGNRAYDMFKVTWKAYAQHFGKRDFVRMWFSDERIAHLKDTIDKRNLICEGHAPQRNVMCEVFGVNCEGRLPHNSQIRIHTSHLPATFAVL
jgi:hypothetical protein